MGQYWIPVNPDKREFIHPHKLGTGMKLWEQLANHPGTGAALVLLLAQRGSLGQGMGDVVDEVTGRWAGDRVVLVGDYAEDGLYAECCGELPAYTDISDLVAGAIERALGGKYEGEGWRTFVESAK